MLAEIEEQDSVRIVRMNHVPENRFSGPFVEALNGVLDEIEEDRRARSAVFTGKPEKFFSNGLDLTWLLQRPKEEWGPFLVSFDRLLHRVFTFPKPLVAAMNGHAFAGGLFLALAMDWRVMREDRGWLCIPEIDLGLDLPPGNVALIAHVIGSRNCEYLAFTGQRLSGTEGRHYGLVDELAPSDQVLARGVAMARRLGAKKTSQFQAHKRSLRQGPARVLWEDDPPYILRLVKEKQQGT
jgi:enoyl-CoA hydratase